MGETPAYERQLTGVSRHEGGYSSLSPIIQKDRDTINQNRVGFHVGEFYVRESDDKMSTSIPGCFRIDDVVVDKYIKVIGATAYGVYSYLAYLSGQDIDSPVQAKIADDLGISKRSVVTCMSIISGTGSKADVLREAGLTPLIAIEKSGRRSVYTILDLSGSEELS